jgi:hypothetical protein
MTAFVERTMKIRQLLILPLIFQGALAAQQLPLDPLKELVTRDFGAATSAGARLLKSEPVALEPASWNLFATDPYLPKELVKIRLTRSGEAPTASWIATAVGSGRLLKRVPPLQLTWERVRISPLQARRIAADSSALARVPFTQAAFQLANNPQTNLPEWGLILSDERGQEVGFIVISAENGAVLHQDFRRAEAPSDKRPRTPEEKGEAAADSVRQGMRDAWDWTERAGRTTGSFFRRLFRGD